MAQEIVITSVRRGIDGESGYQPVLRTRGMKAAVAERMQIRCGYSHPYSHGDPRNPVVFIHRIEKVAGQTLHVLGRICDAGSDHTGRSNFLAHLAALEETEARRKAAGPADVARRFAFKTSWNEPPREADPPPVISGDRGPAACGVWRAAGLDPGLAGDLAEAAANGKEIRLIVRQGDDALALFADAIALLPPAKRWQVTFNTCEIEPFDAVWRAVREDLPQARSWRGTPGVIDLTNPATKGGENSYARFARGEASTLPWQTPVSEPNKPTPAPAAPKAPADLAEEPSRRPEDATPPSSADSPRVAPPTPVEPTPTLPDRPFPPSVRRKPNYLERTVRPSDDRAEFEDFHSPSSNVLRFTGFAVLIVLFTAVVGGFVAVQMNPELLSQIATIFREATHTEDKQVARVGQDEAGGDETSLGADKQAERKRTSAENERKQRDADAADKTEKKDLADKAAQEEARIAAEQKQKEESELADRENARQQLTKKQTDAYAALAHIEGITEEDLPVPSSFGDGLLEQATICNLNTDALIDLSLDLAVPGDRLVEGEAFEATIAPVHDQPLTWTLTSSPSRIFDPIADTIPLATITVKDGKLTLKPDSRNILAKQRFSHLRRSVLLLKARNPDKPNDPIGVVKAIQLVRPVSAPTLTVQLLEDRPTKIKLAPPIGIIADNGAHDSGKFPSSAHVDYEVSYDFALDATPKPEVYRCTWQSTTTETTSFVPLLRCPQVARTQLDKPTLFGLRVKFADGLCEMVATPQFDGPAAKHFDHDMPHTRQNVRRSDEEFEKHMLLMQENVASQIRPFTMPVDTVNVDTLDAYVKNNQKALKVFFEEQPYINWEARRHEIVNQARSVTRPGSYLVAGKGYVNVTLPDFNTSMAPLRQQWQSEIVEPLQRWANDRAKRDYEEAAKMRDDFRYLKTPAHVLIRSITTTAYDTDNNKHVVTLVTAPPNDSPQVDKPGQPLTPEGKPSL